MTQVSFLVSGRGVCLPLSFISCYLFPVTCPMSQLRDLRNLQFAQIHYREDLATVANQAFSIEVLTCKAQWDKSDTLQLALPYIWRIRAS
jgi:hypothetical protein